MMFFNNDYLVKDHMAEKYRWADQARLAQVALAAHGRTPLYQTAAQRAGIMLVLLGARMLQSKQQVAQSVTDCTRIAALSTQNGQLVISRCEA